MSKRLVKKIVITVSLIVMMALLGYGFFESHKSWIESVYYYDSGHEPDPILFGDYPKSGDYQFDPETIFASLDQGKADVFTPLLVDPSDVTVEYNAIAWTQSDFLRVANALSLKVWNEPLDLGSWDVNIISFEGECNIVGFNSFSIIYYKTIKTGWETVYTARTIQLVPYLGVAQWAGDGDFSTPSIFGWENVEWTKVKTTAEQAVRIADENGGKAAGFNTNDMCNIIVSLAKNPNRYYEKDWYIDYYRGATSFDVFVDPYTGKVH